MYILLYALLLQQNNMNRLSNVSTEKINLCEMVKSVTKTNLSIQMNMM